MGFFRFLLSDLTESRAQRIDKNIETIRMYLEAIETVQRLENAVPKRFKTLEEQILERAHLKRFPSA